MGNVSVQPVEPLPHPNGTPMHVFRHPSIPIASTTITNCRLGSTHGVWHMVQGTHIPFINTRHCIGDALFTIRANESSPLNIMTEESNHHPKPITLTPSHLWATVVLGCTAPIQHPAARSRAWAPWTVAAQHCSSSGRPPLPRKTTSRAVQYGCTQCCLRKVLADLQRINPGGRYLAFGGGPLRRRLWAGRPCLLRGGCCPGGPAAAAVTDGADLGSQRC